MFHLFIILFCSFILFLDVFSLRFNIKVTVKERKISTPNTDKEKKPNNGGDKINNTGNPKTGDQTNVGLFTSLLVISALGIAILAVFKKKKALEHK